MRQLAQYLKINIIVGINLCRLPTSENVHNLAIVYSRQFSKIFTTLASLTNHVH